MTDAPLAPDPDAAILGIETSCDETAAAVVCGGRTVLSSPSGWAAEQLGWVQFFVASTAIAIPGLLLLLVLMRLFPPEPKRVEQTFA